MRDELIRASNIRFSYNGSGWELGDISFSLCKGEFVSIIGPNGSGKSTLLRILAGIVKPERGSIFIKGRPLNRKNSMTRREIAGILGYLPQNVASEFDYSVEEVVSLGRFSHLKGIGFLDSDDINAVTHCLKSTDILHLRHRPISQISGGERQLVYLASVLAQEPETLLLDEPTASLDIQHQTRFFSLLSKLASLGLGIVAATHDINLAAVFTDRMLLLNEGRKHKEGTPCEVVSDEVMRPIYGNAIHIGLHPERGVPVVLPLYEKNIEIQER